MLRRPVFVLALALGATGLAAPALADVDVELHPGARVVGSIGPGEPHEVYRVRAPRGATIDVLLRGVRDGGLAPAEGVTAVVSDPNVAPLTAVRTRRTRSTYLAQTTGLYTIRVLPGDVHGAFKLRVRVRTPRRQPFRGNFADAPLTFDIAAEADATAKFVVRARRGSAARPRLQHLRLGFTSVAEFGDSALSTPTVHRVRGVALGETAEYQLTVTDAAGVGGTIAGVAVLRPPHYDRALTDVRLLEPAASEAVFGRLVASSGGQVTVPDQGAFGTGGLAGSAVIVAPGAYPGARSVRLSTARSLEIADERFVPAGPSLRVDVPVAEDDALVTVRLPLDLASLDAAVGVTVYARGPDGGLSAVPPSSLVVDTTSSTVTFPVDLPSATYRAFAPPTEPLQVAGDLDGDGVAELIVRAPDAAQGNGAVFGFSLGPTAATRFTSSSDFTLTLDGPGASLARFGQRAATGDFNGDERDELAVSSFLFDGNRGAVTLFSATAGFGGPQMTARFTVVGQEFEELGDDVALADVDGDGRDDLIVSAVLGGDAAAGVVYVFRGRDFTPAPLVLSTANADRTLRGENADDWFGWSVVADDFTGDGVADIAVSTYPAALVREKVYVFRGGPTLGTDRSAADADIRLTGAGRGDFFGSDLAAGDLSGDGVAELVVGAAAFDATPNGAGTAHGAIYVFAGGPGLSSAGAGSALHRIDGAVSELSLGLSVQVGDVTGDLIGDLLAGASIVDDDFIDADPGNVFVFVGGAGLAPRSTADAEIAIVGDVTGDAFQIVEPPLDVNGDGVRDLIVAAPLEQVGGLAAGTYSVFFGGSRLLAATTATDADVRVIGATGQALGGFPDQ